MSIVGYKFLPNPLVMIEDYLGLLRVL